MPCKCCLEILNNNLISEFVFISAVLFGTMGQWSMPWEPVASAPLRPPPHLLDSPVLDMPLLPGSCPHSPSPHPVTAVTLPGGPGPSAGECWKAGPSLPGLQSFKRSPKSRFCEWILSIFFFLLLMSPLLQNQSLFMVLWASPKITCSVQWQLSSGWRKLLLRPRSDPLLPWVNWRKCNINL